MKHETTQKLYMFAIMIGVTLIIAFIIHLTCKTDVSGADLQVDEYSKCPVCPSCKITIDKIIKDNQAIDLTKYNNVTKFKLPDLENMEVQIGEIIYTKLEIEAIK